MLKWIWLLQLHFANKKLKEADVKVEHARGDSQYIVALVRWGFAHQRVLELQKKIDGEKK